MARGERPSRIDWRNALVWGLLALAYGLAAAAVIAALGAETIEALQEAVNA